MRGAIRYNGRNTRRNHVFNGSGGHFNGKSDSLGPYFSADGLLAVSNFPLTNTRASALTIIDYNGIYHQAQNNELCFNGFRRVRNLFLNSEAPVTQTITVVATTYVLQAEGTGTLTLSGAFVGSLVVAGNHKRLAFTPTAGALTITLSGGTPTWVCLKRTTGEPDPTAPVEKVSSTTIYNAGIAGVRYFTTTNGNTANGSGVVTLATGSPITNAWRGMPNPVSSTNNCTYSEDLIGAGWTPDGLSRANDGTKGPDGVGQLQKMTDTTANAVHRFYNLIAGTSTHIAAKLHIKSGGTIPFFRLRLGDAVNNCFVDFNCSTMAISASGVAGAATTIRSLSITRLGLTDIYELNVGATASIALARTYVVNFCQTSGNLAAYIGTLQYAYLGFAQHEDRESATPYIPNISTGSTTRQANVIEAALSGLDGGRDLAMILTHRPYYAPNSPVKTATYVTAKIGSVGTDELKIEALAASADVSAVKLIAGVANTSSSTSTTGVNDRVKWGLSVTSNKVRIARNGVLGVENSNTTPATNNSNFRLTSSNVIFEKIEIYRRTMPAAEFQTRTTL